jgi:4-amino-4-deoxy-L-arabinose transferase-like glycosyltransferase
MTLDRKRPATPVRWTVLLIILAAAVTARLWHLTAGVPFAVAIDEPQVVDRAIRILKTGDWNTHAFDYPSLVIYFHAAIAIVRFLWGAIDGEWASLDGFTVQAIYSTGRLAAALVGAATVWLTYKLGSELDSRDARLALLAAAQMAVRPMHVRESHYILTDVPMTALTVLALWLTLRAARVATARAFAWAGAMCGLAAAAKYTGGVAFAAVFVAWLVYERRSRDRARKIAAAVGAAALAFLVAAPFTVLDLPAFLDGFAAQFARFAAPARTVDPSWLLYAKHLWIDGPVALVFAVAGIVLVVARRSTRALWAPVLAFAAVYFYVLSTHSHVFGRYALPLLPVECLLSSAAVLELAALAPRVPALARPGARHAVLAGIVAVVLFGPIAATVGWLDHLKRADTREIAADWLEKSAPKASRIAVENSGPSYLNAAGFQVLSTETLVDHDPDWYRERADYLVVSADDLTRYRELLAAGTTVFEIAPTPQRWGPRIRIVKLANR